MNLRVLRVSVVMAGWSVLCAGLSSVPAADASFGPWAMTAQRRVPRRPTAEEVLQDYYRQYPDRYIRVSKESWHYDEKSHAATHSFILTNTANATYSDMQVRFTYQTGKGKTLYTQTLSVQGTLSPYKTLAVKGMKVKDVPVSAEIVLVVIAKASVHR